MKNNNKGLFITIIICTIVIIATVTANTIVLAHTTPTTQEQITVQIDGSYVLRAEVVNVDQQENLVTYVDTVGNEWTSYDADQYEGGEFVLLLMDTCETTTIYDDEIIAIRTDAFAY